MEKRLTMILACLFLSIGMALAQKAVTGTVVSQEDGQPIIGATIRVVGANVGAVTDADGKFSLSLPSGHNKLKVTYVGMIDQDVTVKGNNIRVVLTPDETNLDEVMVVAYGTAKKSAFTGSAAVVKSEDIAKSSVANPVDALTGKVSGVQINSATGQPGQESFSIRIRGVSSINAGNDPLIILDGAPYDGDLNSISNQDIASMTVLKDAASAALYGARGANGVVIITTKSGREGTSSITVDAKWGSNSKALPEYNYVNNPAKYYELWYTALNNYAQDKLGYNANQAYLWANQNLTANNAYGLGYNVYTVPEGQTLIGINGRLNPNATLGRVISYNGNEYTLLPDDWRDASYQNGLRQEYTLTATGSNAKGSFYGSANYLNNEGITMNSDYERFTGRLKADYQLRDWFKLSGNMSYTHSNSNYLGNDGSSSDSGNLFAVNNVAPIYPIYVRDGNGNIIINKATGLPTYDYGDGDIIGITRPVYTQANPFSDIQLNTDNIEGNALNAVGAAEIRFLKDFKFTSTNSVMLDEARQTNTSQNLFGQTASMGGSIAKYHTRTWAYNYQQLLNWHRLFGKHDVEVMLGHEYYRTRSYVLVASRTNIFSLTNTELSGAITDGSMDSYTTDYNTEGFFGRAQYNYDNKYFGSVSYRRDASSRFHPDNRWGNFWSVSAAWDMAKENFISQYDWINMLKLKASFGQQGNDNLYYKGYTNYYPYLDQFTVSGSDGVFSDGVLYYKGSKDITWETSNSFNVGVDFALLGGRIDGTIEYFNRQTKDMLYYKPVAMSNGYTQLPMNIGSVRNSGVEIELNYTPIETNDLKWVINWNGTLMKNKILELHPDLKGEMIDGSYIYREGESLYQMYLTKYAGVDPDSGEALYWAKDENGVEYKDKDWSAAYNSNRQASGDLLPTIYGGVGTTLEFRGFDFSIQCAYQLGGTIYDSGYQAFMHGGDSHYMGYNWHKDILNAWTPENRNTNIPRVDAIDKYTNSSSDRWLTSSDYFSINNITLGYTLPKRWLRSLGIGSLRIYGAADNVALFSARKGLDPRMSYTTASTDRYTPIRTISGGLKVTF